MTGKDEGPNPKAPFGAPSLEQLTGLVFELALQLHVERVRRIALEAALEQGGVIAPDSAERIIAQAGVRARCASALDRALAGMMRVITEDADPRAPLRAQAESRF